MALTAERKYRLLVELSQRISRTLDLGAVLDDLLQALRSAIASHAARALVARRLAAGSRIGDRLRRGRRLRAEPRGPAAGGRQPDRRHGAARVRQAARGGSDAALPPRDTQPRAPPGRHGG